MGLPTPNPRAAFLLSASLIYNLASLQAKHPCLGSSLVYLHSLPASPIAQTMALYFIDSFPKKLKLNLAVKLILLIQSKATRIFQILNDQ
jgi:hypothetical protein